MPPEPTNAALVTLAREVRDRTLRLIELATAAELTWTPPRLDNHALWHAGHALYLADQLIIAELTGRSELPAGWGDAFGWDCRPPPRTARWPTRAQLHDLLRMQLTRVVELLGSADPADLDAPSPRANRGWTRSRWIIHALHDEASHQGEIYLLLKMQRGRS